jgi:hypothetical protein
MLEDKLAPIVRIFITNLVCNVMGLKPPVCAERNPSLTYLYVRVWYVTLRFLPESERTIPTALFLA